MPFDGTKTQEALNLDLLCADILAAGERFTLKRYEHPCGAPACIAGHALAIWPDLAVHENDDDFLHWTLFAAKIGVEQAGLEALCYRFDSLTGCSYNLISRVKPQVAVAALKRLRETGEAYYDLADDVEKAA